MMARGWHGATRGFTAAYGLAVGRGIVAGDGTPGASVRVAARIVALPSFAPTCSSPRRG